MAKEYPVDHLGFIGRIKYNLFLLLILAVLVNGKQLTVGVVGGVEVVLDKPMTPSEIQVRLSYFSIYWVD